MKVKEVIKKLESVGWVFARQKGSHKTFKKTGVAELITVADHGTNEDMKTGTLKAIRKTAGWD
jgi:predicted RNA binding protein YcfA (HicA-like mRNA interferase family)